MKNIFKISGALACGIAAVAVIVNGCAKSDTLSENELNKLYLEAWMKVHYPGVNPTGLGIYIIDDQPGSGELVGDTRYVMVDYSVTDLDGTISSTTIEKVAQQVGSYSNSTYYGPQVATNDKDYTSAGIREMIKTMRVGGTRTAVIPGWINVTSDYDTAEEYLENGDGENAIYTLTVKEVSDDIIQWQIDTLEKYVAINMAGVDSTGYGYYYHMLKAPSRTDSLSRDTSYYINYVGRLLNGKVFDTNIKDSAKFYGIYSSKKTYEPQKVSLAEDFTEITMGVDSETGSGSTVVHGFAYCLSNLRLHEKGVCAFISDYGYGYSGSGSSIPAYAPISFMIEVVEPDE